MSGKKHRPATKLAYWESTDLSVIFTRGNRVEIGVNIQPPHPSSTFSCTKNPLMLGLLMRLASPPHPN